MKRILSIAFALALAGGLLTGCDRDYSSQQPAGAGSSTTQSDKAPAAPGGTQKEQQKRTPQSLAKP